MHSQSNFIIHIFMLESGSSVTVCWGLKYEPSQPPTTPLLSRPERWMFTPGGSCIIGQLWCFILTLWQIYLHYNSNRSVGFICEGEETRYLSVWMCRDDGSYERAAAAVPVSGAELTRRIEAGTGGGLQHYLHTTHYTLHIYSIQPRELGRKHEYLRP